MIMTDEIDDDALAHDMIEVHGTRTAAVARENARAAALAGQAMQAKSWIRMLGIIQRRQAGQVSPLSTSCNPSAGGTAKRELAAAGGDKVPFWHDNCLAADGASTLIDAGFLVVP
jgi:hypothetical protein